MSRENTMNVPSEFINPKQHMGYPPYNYIFIKNLLMKTFRHHLHIFQSNGLIIIYRMNLEKT